MNRTESDRLRQVGTRLEWATVGWNVGEFFITVGLGIAAGSIGLVGFGFDSLIEVFASLVVVWHARSPDHPEILRRTRRAHAAIAVAFALLAVSLIALAVERLLSGDVPRESPWGIAYLAVTALVMFGLGIAKRRIGTRIDSSPLRSEATMTILDGMLATGVLVSLVLTAIGGYSWADPVAALLVAALSAREAWENLDLARHEG